MLLFNHRNHCRHFHTHLDPLLCTWEKIWMPFEQKCTHFACKQRCRLMALLLLLAMWLTKVHWVIPEYCLLPVCMCVCARACARVLFSYYMYLISKGFGNCPRHTVCFVACLVSSSRIYKNELWWSLGSSTWTSFAIVWLLFQYSTVYKHFLMRTTWDWFSTHWLKLVRSSVEATFKWRHL